MESRCEGLQVGKIDGQKCLFAITATANGSAVYETNTRVLGLEPLSVSISSEESVHHQKPFSAIFIKNSVLIILLCHF